MWVRAVSGCLVVALDVTLSRVLTQGVPGGSLVELFVQVTGSVREEPWNYYMGL